jgi:hypothetical protein
MKLLRMLIIGALAGITILAAVATSLDWGVEDIEHPQGISLRQDSVTRTGRRGFFGGYRSHYGGGPRTGK